MTNISGLRKGDVVVFSNGHESSVLRIEEDEYCPNIRFINQFGREQSLYFTKRTGRADGTDYEIAKIIRA